MKLIPYRLKKVAEDTRVLVSEHFFYTDFGVCESRKTRDYGRTYVCEGTPGMGFIERDSESHSYHEFIRDIHYRQRPSYWKMVTGQEPDYAREIARTKVALGKATDPKKREILECYGNALAIGKQEEYLERVAQAIKKKIGHHSNKFLVSVLSYYKNKMSQLDSDMREVELHVKNTCSPEVYAAYDEMVMAFRNVAACRRVWHLNEAKRQRFIQVWFDHGTFDFIRNEHYLPILRTSAGENLYLLPEHVIVARSSVDFDVVPLRKVSLICQELAIEETVESLSSRLGDAASMMRIPELGHTWYFNHVRPVMHFFETYERLRGML
jgi:hypothetical protein